MAVKLAQKVTKENRVGLVVALLGLLVLLLFVLVGFKIASDKRAKNTGQAQEEQQESRLADNAENSSVRFYMEGGVTADEEFYSIEMIVSARSRTIRVLQGYESNEERSEGLPNNVEAYSAFLKALDGAGYTIERVDKSGLDWREACPESKRYSFALYDEASQEFDRWHSFCGGDRYGTYGGRVNDVQKLFREQFPNYSTVTRGITF